MWLCAANALVLEVALLELAPHDLRLCAQSLALVPGLYVMNFAYFAECTACNTLKKDSVAVAVFVTAVGSCTFVTTRRVAASASGSVISAGAVGVGCHCSRVLPRDPHRRHAPTVRPRALSLRHGELRRGHGGVYGDVLRLDDDVPGGNRRFKLTVPTVEAVLVALMYASVIA